MQQDMGCNHCGSGASCMCMHHKMVPLFIFLLGLTFLLGILHVLSSSLVNIVWPILIMLIGLVKLFGGMCSCCGAKK